MSEGIRNNKLHEVIDASMLHNQMGGFLKIVNFENQIIMIKEILNKKWGVNSLKSAEESIMLEILEFLKEHALPKSLINSLTTNSISSRM